ncbi:MAG: glycosyltransferase family 1 protein, partial [Desulfuromonadaceae bacterium]
KVFSLPYVPPSYLFLEHDADESRIQNLPKKYLFYPAQFWDHKNHFRLLKAVACLVSELPDLQLVLVGGPKGAYQEVQKLILSLGIEKRVKILGYVSMPQMRAIYRGARALIMPSIFGPTNIPPLEAMALGCPVAVSSNYAMAEQVGSAGLLFDPYSVEEISAVIARLWNDDRLCAEMSTRGIEKSREWTQVHFNKRLESIISRILNANNEI